MPQVKRAKKPAAATFTGCSARRRHEPVISYVLCRGRLEEYPTGTFFEAKDGGGSWSRGELLSANPTEARVRVLTRGGDVREVQVTPSMEIRPIAPFAWAAAKPERKRREAVPEPPHASVEVSEDDVPKPQRISF